MKLNDWLQKNDVSMEDFAKKIGTKPLAVRRYINGQRIPQEDVMVKITKKTNGEVMPNDFYGVK